LTDAPWRKRCARSATSVFVASIALLARVGPRGRHERLFYLAIG
jgi:hypothetical protein